MPRNAPGPAPLPSAVLELPCGPLGPRFRVRGLRGNDALAQWLKVRTALEGDTGLQDRIIASAASGIVRIDARGFRQDHQWKGGLERALATYGLAAGTGRARGAHESVRREPTRESPRSLPPEVLKPRARPAPASAATPGFAHSRTSSSRAQPPAVAAQAAAGSAHDRPLAALLDALEAAVGGLTAGEAKARFARDGANEIRDITARPDLEILTDQFNSVPVALLAGSGAVALASRAYGDAVAIGAVLAANGAIGFVTERRAEQTVSALRKLAPGSATVLRDGRPSQVAAREVVVGDVLVLKPGEPVAADARVVESHRLSANEAPLTGESLPVRKEPVDRLPTATPIGERRNMLHMGTVISGGTGLAVVVATGERTMLGSIRALAQKTEAPRTRLQVELDGLGKRLAVGATALCAGVFGIGLARGRAALPLLRTAVSLGVAAIPEGLPTVATSLLAAGIRTLQKRNVFARRLDAIENLGAIDVVGFDKTGTLTQNRMTVADVVIGRQRLPADALGRGGHSWPPDFALVCALCNDLERAADGSSQGSSTESALIDLVAAHGSDVDALRRRHPRLEVKQRSEHHPYMVTLHPAGKQSLVAMKGRPQEVLERCTSWYDGRRVVPLTSAARRRLLRANHDLSVHGRRVLALAIRRQASHRLAKTGGLTWLGLVGLADPLRPGIAESIARFRAAGIRPVMLTGDQMGTARAIAHEIGLDGTAHVADAGALPEDARQLGDVVEQSATFARSSPAMKLAIIRALQDKGHVVAMTGDGINDGPALKTADVGVAMGASGTDFAQAMSDLVLRDDHPDGLLAAIAEGRTSYLNVKKAVQYLVSTNVSELALMGLSVAAGLPDPLDPLALLWTNLITDVTPAIALGLEPPEPDILLRPPFPRSASFLSRKDWKTVALDGGAMTVAALAAFVYGLGRYGPTPRARTIAFMTLTSAQLLYALSARSEAPLELFGNGRLRANPWLTRTVVLSLGAQTATVLFPPLRAFLKTTPLGLGDAAVVGVCAATPTLLRELRKRLRAQRDASAQSTAA